MHPLQAAKFLACLQPFLFSDIFSDNRHSTRGTYIKQVPAKLASTWFWRQKLSACFFHPRPNKQMVEKRWSRRLKVVLFGASFVGRSWLDMVCSLFLCKPQFTQDFNTESHLGVPHSHGNESPLFLDVTAISPELFYPWCRPCLPKLFNTSSYTRCSGAVWSYCRERNMRRVDQHVCRFTFLDDCQSLRSFDCTDVAPCLVKWPQRPLNKKSVGKRMNDIGSHANRAFFETTAVWNPCILSVLVFMSPVCLLQVGVLALFCINLFGVGLCLLSTGIYTQSVRIR